MVRKLSVMDNWILSIWQGKTVYLFVCLLISFFLHSSSIIFKFSRNAARDILSHNIFFQITHICICFFSFSLLLFYTPSPWLPHPLISLFFVSTAQNALADQELRMIEQERLVVSIRWEAFSDSCILLHSYVMALY